MDGAENLVATRIVVHEDIARERPDILRGVYRMLGISCDQTEVGLPIRFPQGAGRRVARAQNWHAGLRAGGHSAADGRRRVVGRHQCVAGRLG